jgi:Fungal protein kinase
LAWPNVTAYLSDQSGVLGSKTFDMHEVSSLSSSSAVGVAEYYLLKQPEFLIRVIAGCALFKPSKLGWDTTMMIVLRQLSNKVPCMSFEVPYNELKVGHDWNNHYWRVEMLKPRVDEPSNMSEEMEAFILFQHLRLIRGEVIMGRATRVWKA